MDPEVARQLEEAFNDLNRTSGRLNVGLAILSDGLAKTGKAMGASDEALKRYNAAVTGNTRAVDNNTGKFQGNSDAVKQNTEMMYALKSAGKDTVGAFLSLGKTMLDAKGSFGAYGDAVNKAGNAAADLASEFGIVGKILGLFIKGATKVVEYQLKQADAVIKGVDQLGKLGAAGAMTGDQLVKFAHSAGYTTQQLDKLIKPIESMKSGLVVLGGNAQEGAKEFAKMAAVGQQTRESFRRLGVSQEELTQHQADYVALQARSGRSISQEMKDRGGLQKASLEYTKNLVELSAITGKSVEEAKKELEATQATYTRALANAALGAEEAKLRKIMNSEADADQKAKAKARLDEIEAIKKNRDQVDKALSSVPLNEAQKAAYQEFIETGRRTKDFNETFGQLNINFEAQREKFLKGQMSEGEFRESLKKGILDRVEQVGDSARIAGEDFGKQVGLGAEMVKFAASNSAQDLAEGAKDAKEKIGEAAAGKGEVGEDPVQKARNTMVENEIKAATAADALAWSTNAIAKGYFPELGDTVQKLTQMLEKAIEFIQKFWKEISIAVGVLMGISVVGKLKGIAKGLGGAGGIGKGILKGAKGFVGKAALPVAGALAAYDAYQGFQADKDAPLTQRLKNAGSSALSGVTFGLMGTSAEDIAAQKAAKAAAPGSAVPEIKPTAAKAAPGSTVPEIKPPAVDEKLANDWAWSVYSGLATPDKVPKHLVARVDQILKNPPAHWTPDAVKKAKERKAAKDAAITAQDKPTTPVTTGTDPYSQYKAQMGGPANAEQLLTASGGGNKALEDNTKALQNLTLQISKLATPGQSLTEATQQTTTLGSPAADMSKTMRDMKRISEEKLEEFRKTGMMTADLSKSLQMPSADISNFGADMGPSVSQMTSMGMTPRQMFELRKAMMKQQSMGGMNFGNMPAMDSFKSFGMPSMQMPSTAGIVPKGASASRARPATTSGSNDGGFFSNIGSGLGGLLDSGMNYAREAIGSAAGWVKDKVTGGSGGSMGEQEIKNMIIQHEGIRYRPYQDSLGLWTVGVGHLIGDGKSLPPSYNREFSQEEVMAMFDKDYEHHRRAAEKIPGFNKMDTMGQGALTDLTFNMGPVWYKKWPRFSKALEEGNTELAAQSLENSKWYTQVGRRAPTITSMIENAKVTARMGGIAKGPESGYPAALHGTEMIVPLDPNSVLAELGKKSSGQISKEVQEKTGKLENLNPEVFNELTKINQAMMEMLSNKLDTMINKIENGNDTQTKILQYTRA